MPTYAYLAGRLAVGLLAGSILSPTAAAADYHALPAAVSSLRERIRGIAGAARGKVAVACSLPGEILDCDLNPEETPPMQSVFKLPLALTVLHQVEQGSLSLDQRVHFGPADRILPATHSPLQERYPEANVDVSIRDLLQLTVSESDNVAADLLLEVVGGPQRVSDYVVSIGVHGFHLVDSEHVLHRDPLTQYRNWFTPAGAVQLLRCISDKPPISRGDTGQLLAWLSDSPRPRLKADLPAGTPVAHKAGSSGAGGGIAPATNDVGLITLPNGKTLAVAVFVTDSRADERTREAVISRIAKAIYDAAVPQSGARLAQFAREELSRQDASGFIHVRDVESNDVVLHVTRSAQAGADLALSLDSPIRPLSVIKVYLAASWLEHGFGNTVLTCSVGGKLLRGPLAGEIFNSGCDAAGVEMATILRRNLGGARALSDLHGYGLQDVTLRPDASDSDWGSTLSLGEENVRVTPRQVSAFFAAICRPDGRLFSHQTAESLRHALEGVVQHGTASATANALANPNWRLAGKTGTGPGRCGQRCDGWFASILSRREQPRYVILVFIRGRGLGGGVAARTAASTANYLIATEATG